MWCVFWSKNINLKHRPQKLFAPREIVTPAAKDAVKERTMNSIIFNVSVQRTGWYIWISSTDFYDIVGLRGARTNRIFHVFTVIPLLLLFCHCGETADLPGAFTEMPFAIKPHLINYHTEGQGENTVFVDLLFRVIWFSTNRTSLILCLTDFGQQLWVCCTSRTETLWSLEVDFTTGHFIAGHCIFCI